MAADASDTPGDPHIPPDGQSTMSDELVALLRQRVANRYYEHPRVIDVLARRLLQLGSS